MTRRQVAVVVLVLLVCAGLWLFPYVFFASPGINEAIALSNLTFPLLGVIFAGAMALAVVGAVRTWPSTGAIAAGTLLLGTAADFVITLVAVGNMSDDRFMPLLFLPPAFGIVGAIVLVVGFVARRTGVARGFVMGGAAAIFLLVWILVRGARDWVLAPYGFDVFLLVGLETAVLFWAGAAFSAAHPKTRAHPSA